MGVAHGFLQRIIKGIDMSIEHVGIVGAGQVGSGVWLKSVQRRACASLFVI
tara:strand:- start:80 stop:232 length:153 start_codon:yes stop_codon:yes gene_type:complete